MKLSILFLPYVLTPLIFEIVQAANNTLPGSSVAILPLCAQECLVKAFMVCEPPCGLLDMTCACKCLPFHGTTQNCTQSSCSPGFVQSVLDLIDAPCQTVTPVLNTETATPTSPSTAEKTSPATTATSADSDITGTSLPTISHTTLPQTTYTNPSPDHGPSETITVYGRPTPCSTLASKPSDCGPLINPSSKAVIEFDGAAGANYSVEVTLDDSILVSDNALSISTIRATIDVPYLCTLITIDYPVTFIEGPLGTWAIGAPQTVKSISCGKRNTNTASSAVLSEAGEEKLSNVNATILTSESYVPGRGLIPSVLRSLGVLSLVFILM